MSKTVYFKLKQIKKLEIDWQLVVLTLMLHLVRAGQWLEERLVN